MISATRFDPEDQSTWPPKDKAVLWLYQTTVGRLNHNGKYETCVAELQTPFSNQTKVWFEVVGASGYECDNEFDNDQIIAWQPIPTWGDFAQ